MNKLFNMPPAVSLCTLLLGFLFIISGDAHALSKSQKGWLGVSIEEMTPSMVDEYEIGNRTGLLITDVVHNSPADDAGLWEDDVIVEFNGKAVAIAKDFSKSVRAHKPGATVKLKIVRDGEEKTIEVTLGKLKSQRRYLRRIDENVFFISDRPQLGIRVEELNSDLAPYFQVEEGDGVLIWEVFEGSPAEKAGLKAGDVITQLDEEKISDAEDLIATLEEYEEDDEVKIKYIRKGQAAEVEVVLKEADPQDFHFSLPRMPRIRIKEFKRFDDAPSQIIIKRRKRQSAVI
ncbi:MAG: PDZ domain-containing protein [bacterium]